VYQTTVYTKLDREADELVKRIIAANRGSDSGATRATAKDSRSEEPKRTTRKAITRGPQSSVPTAASHVAAS
jgi:hypothetical protein